jgi:hypothetical protein
MTKDKQTAADIADSVYIEPRTPLATRAHVSLTRCIAAALTAVREEEREAMLEAVPPRVPLYDQFDNFHPSGKDIDPKFASGWNAARAVLEIRSRKG